MQAFEQKWNISCHVFFAQNPRSKQTVKNRLVTFAGFCICFVEIFSSGCNFRFMRNKKLDESFKLI